MQRISQTSVSLILLAGLIAFVLAAQSQPAQTPGSSTSAFTETGKEQMAGWSFLYSARSKEKLEEREASPATLIRTSSNPP